MNPVRHGRWQDVLAGVTPDSVIADIPYGPRTVSGYVGNDGSTVGIDDYSAMTPEEAAAFAVEWAQRVSRWFVMFGSHDQILATLAALESVPSVYSFPPVGYCKTDATPRLMADGPACGLELMAVCRPRRKLDRVEKRFRPAFYRGPYKEKHSGRFVTGQKPLWLMRALVRDYSEPGDLVVDPTAGSGSTVVAALMEGRRAIGAEIDAERCDIANRRSRQIQGQLFSPRPVSPTVSTTSHEKETPGANPAK